MKKKLLTTLICAVCALFCAAFFGCNLGNDNSTDSGSPDIFDTGSPSPDIYGPLYEITYETTEYLLQAESTNPQYAREGETVTITTTIIIDADLAVYANGEKLEQVPYDAYYWAYTFVMPDEPVHITFDVVSTTYLTEFEPWLAEISAEDIASIKQSDEIAGIAPGNFIKYYTVTDGESIEQLLCAYQCLGMELCAKDCYVTGGLSRTVTFTMKDGTTRSLDFYQGLYMLDSFSSFTHYHAINMPNIADYPSCAKSYSFITVSGNCDIYTVKFGATKFGRDGYLPDELVGKGDFLGDLEFVEYHGEIPENEPAYCLVGEYFENENAIYVLDKSLFFIAISNGYGHIDYVYYHVLGDVDLNALIEQSLQNP